MNTTDCISLTVCSPERTVLEKTVCKVSLPGTMGRFMVLKDHAPLISSLEEGDIVFESGRQEGRLAIKTGFVEIAYNKVTVCAEL